MKNLFASLIAIPILLVSCVSTKKFKAAQAEYDQLQVKYVQSQNDIKNCEDTRAELLRHKNSLDGDNAGLNKRIGELNKQIDFLKENNTTVLNQLKDLSVVSATQAESIKK